MRNEMVTGTRMVAFALSVCIVLAGSCSAAAAQQRKTMDASQIRVTPVIPDANFPELLYWFLTPSTLRDGQYLKDVDHIADDTPFTLAFLTPRSGAKLTDSATHEKVSELVAAAHRKGLKIGIQFPFRIFDEKSDRSQDQSTISEAEFSLGPDGDGTATLQDQMRIGKPLESRLLRVFAFKKTADGEYAPDSMRDVTDKTTQTAVSPGSVTIRVRGGSAFAGLTAYAMVESVYNWTDMFSPAYVQRVHHDLDQYRDIPLDGTALDEFGYIVPPWPLTQPFRDRIGGKAFAETYERETGMNFVTALFNMRYSPAGHPEVRIEAIDKYWKHLREGPLAIEQEFYRYSRQLFGQATFAGIHDTYHDHLTNDEPWTTGINWWQIPRQYGQSDEDIILPVRMGLLVSHPGNIMYDQFYGHDIPKFAVKAMRDALYGARLHYHGYNDVGTWGADLSKSDFLSVIDPVEAKIRLLNQFDPAPPDLPLLIVFGMPAQLNWYPDAAARNPYDVNGKLDIEKKSQQVWDAGYRCALVPTDLIDNGALSLNTSNQPVLNGHVFRAVIFLYPQYSTEKTIDFLDRYSRGGGRLMTEGEMTRNFDGKDVSVVWQKIAARAIKTSFSVADIDALGMNKDPFAPSGARLEDGSLVQTDLASIQGGKPKPFNFRLAGHEYTGSFAGLVALKVAPSGEVEKFACGQCSQLLRDGKNILKLQVPHDLVLKRDHGKVSLLAQSTEDIGKVEIVP